MMLGLNRATAVIACQPHLPNLLPLALVIATVLCGLPCVAVRGQDNRREVLTSSNLLTQLSTRAELKTAKLYGAGGAGLDAYQSGFFITAEGHILTAWSTVLDVDEVIVATGDGARVAATMVGIEPNLGLAVLKSPEPAPDFFDLDKAPEAEVGQRVLAISNLYGIAAGDEMSSVQKGVVMAKTSLNARRGRFESVYQGPIYVIDAMTNNPGAAGGALIDFDGQLLGILGKELRDSRANIWLNYAIPVSEFRESIRNLIAGKLVARRENARTPSDRPASLEALGMVLTPDVLNKTPAFVDLVEPNSPAARSGLQPDDLILFVNSLRVPSQAELRRELIYIDRNDELTLLVQRGNELVEITLAP